MREYWGSGYRGGSGGGGGGGGGSTYIIPAAVNLAEGDVIYITAAGEAALADPSLALSPVRYNAVGVARFATVAGTSAIINGDMITQAAMHFGVAPLAADNGKEVYLSTTAGQATLTPPGAGNAVVYLGILQGADGATTTPNVLLQFQVIALVP
jgi:hypothetical protein